MSRGRAVAVVLAALLAALAPLVCNGHREPALVDFTRVPSSSGLRFRHELPGGRMDNLPKSAMGGLAVLDFDGDGRMDVYFVNGGWHDQLGGGARPDTLPANRLFRNLGGMRFEDVTRTSGVDDTRFGMGACVGDIDNDGFPDIFVSNYAGSRLYHNRGDGTFEDIAVAAGIAPGMHAGAAFLDYDRDGFLDLYVSQYVDVDAQVYPVESMQEGTFPGPAAYDPQPASLYRNRGDLTFEDVTGDAGIGAGGKGMGAIASDLDDDGWMDIIVANDGMANFVWRNRGDGTFTDTGATAGLAFGVEGQGRASMGITAADVTGDGRLDYLIPDTEGGSMYVARKTWFTDRSREFGFVQQTLGLVGWSDVALDADNDGWVDLYKTHGDLRTLTQQPSRFYRNLGGQFDLVEEVAVGKVDACARGGVAVDLDDDGRQDLVVLALDGPARVLRNVTENAGNWIRFHLVGTRSNRMAIGARLRATVRGEEGPRTLVQEVLGAAGYVSAPDPRVHFGLGAADELETLHVRWPSGAEQTLGPFDAGETHVLREP